MSITATTTNKSLLKKHKGYAYFTARVINHKMMLFMNLLFALLSFVQFAFFSDNTYSDMSILVFAVSLIGFMVMAYILGITSFGYLHNKSLTDMIISLPVKKKTRFWGDYFAGLSIIVLPYIASFAVSLPIFTLCYNRRLDAVLEIAPAGLLILVMTYSMTVCMTSFCGRIFEAASVPLMLGVIIPVTMLVFVFTVYGNTYGLSYDLSQFSLPIVSSSAFSLAVWAFYQSTLNAYSHYRTVLILSEVLLALATTSVFVIGAYYLNKSRKPEHTGKSFPIKSFFHIYITMITFCITSAFMYFIIKRLFDNGLVMYDTSITVGMLLPCMLLVTAGVFLLFDIINNKGVKKPLLIFFRWAVTVGCTAGICLGLNFTGGLGEVDYIPAADKVKAVSVSKPMYNFDGSFHDITTPYDYGMTLTEKENIELINEFHERSLTLKNDDFKNIGEYSYSFESFTYYLNSGKTVARSYPATEYTMEPLKKLFISDEYREMKLKSTRELFYDTTTTKAAAPKIEIYRNAAYDYHYDEDTGEYYYTEVYDNLVDYGYVIETSNRDIFDSFMEAYKKDLYAETAEEMFSGVEYDNGYAIYRGDLNEYTIYIQDGGIWQYDLNGGGFIQTKTNTIIVKMHYKNLIEFVESFLD